MSGGGGDGGASKRQAELEAKKQTARDALNVLFGQSPSGSANINKDDFYRATLDTSQDTPRTVNVFDQGAYDAAVASANSMGAADAAKNKAGRDALYADIRSNAFNAGKRSIDDQTADAKRNLRFELFAKGLNGGSTDIDQNARLQRTYDTGILNLGAKADAASADVRSNDESTRLGLLQSIDAGMDQGSAVSSALNQLKINSDRAASGAAQTAVDDLFGNAGLLYQQSQQAKGVADARNAALYGNTRAGASSKSYKPAVTPTGG